MAAGQRRLHQPGQDSVDPDAEFGEFQRAVARQHLDAGLGRDIGRTGVHRHMRVQRGDVDDAAVALPHHLPRLVLHAEEDALQAEIDGEVPVRFGQIDDVAGAGSRRRR